MSRNEKVVNNIKIEINNNKVQDFKYTQGLTKKQFSALLHQLYLNFLTQFRIGIPKEEIDNKALDGFLEHFIHDNFSKLVFSYLLGLCCDNDSNIFREEMSKDCHFKMDFNFFEDGWDSKFDVFTNTTDELMGFLTIVIEKCFSVSKRISNETYKNCGYLLKEYGKRKISNEKLVLKMAEKDPIVRVFMQEVIKDKDFKDYVKQSLFEDTIDVDSSDIL